jgi:hypothetical protein
MLGYYHILTNNKIIAMICRKTIFKYALSLLKVKNRFLISSPATTGISKKKDKIPKPGVQGPLGESLSSINIVATAIA